MSTLCQVNHWIILWPVTNTGKLLSHTLQDKNTWSQMKIRGSRHTFAHPELTTGQLQPHWWRVEIFPAAVFVHLPICHFYIPFNTLSHWAGGYLHVASPSVNVTRFPHTQEYISKEATQWFTSLKFILCTHMKRALHGKQSTVLARI